MLSQEIWGRSSSPLSCFWPENMGSHLKMRKSSMDADIGLKQKVYEQNPGYLSITVAELCFMLFQCL